MALAIVVLMVAGLVGVVAIAEDGSRNPDLAAGLNEGPARTFDLAPDGTVLGDLDPVGAAAAALVSDLHGFVAEARGLAFLDDVKVELLSPADFVRRLAAESVRDEQDLADLRETSQVLAAFHLLDAGVDLAEEIDGLLAASVAGFYDNETGELVVRGTELDSPQVRLTIVHELTHAIQDQHFELHRPDLDDRDDEASFAFSGLVEGDATRIEAAYKQKLSLEDQKRAEQEEQSAGSGIDPSTPRILLELLGFPYLFGPVFANTVYGKGGQPALDNAFREPPTTSEQILDPGLFLTGRSAPVDVAKPDADGAVIDEGVFGEYALMLLLARTKEGPPVSVRDVAAGWRGDWYRAWVDGSRTCARTRIATAGVVETRGLQRALTQWKRGRSGATVVVEADGAILFTSCS
ncbi:MAG: DUF6782 family putative metallopeptidase [Acidimicrobiales bacterium]